MTDPIKIFDGLMVMQYRSGSKKAMSLLVEKYHVRLCKHSYGYTHNIDDSKDIVQECWRIIIRKIDSLKNPDLFGSWAFRIVTRKSLDFVQEKKSASIKLNNYYKAPVLDDSIEDNETEIQRLLKAVKTLPKDQQTVLRLFYRERYSLKEISYILEISVGTVKSRLYHGRERLKIILKN